MIEYHTASIRDSSPSWNEDEINTAVEVPRPHYSESLYEISNVLQHYLDEDDA